MTRELSAVIFDMDGVLINSEHLWRKAMIKGFSEYSMDLTDDECRSTMGMRFKEVIQIWLKSFKLSFAVDEIENRVLQLLLQLIEQEGHFIPGVESIILFCAEEKIPMGLATSSSEILMDAVLKKLNLENTLQAVVSAEHMKYGKPHPEVFITCAEKLGVAPQHCLVIEDSVNGVIAGKAAQMTVIAVPDDDHQSLKQFALADYKFYHMTEALACIRMLFRPAQPITIKS